MNNLYEFRRGLQFQLTVLNEYVCSLPIIQKSGIVNPTIQKIYFFTFGWILTHLFISFCIPADYLSVFSYIGQILLLTFTLFSLRILKGFCSENVNVQNTIRSYLLLHFRFIQMWVFDNTFLTGAVVNIMFRTIGWNLLTYFLPAVSLYIYIIFKYPITPISFRTNFDFSEEPEETVEPTTSTKKEKDS